MIELNFSDEILLPENQRTNVVIDGVSRTITSWNSEKNQDQYLRNYFLKKENGELKLYSTSISLQTDRNFDFFSSISEKQNGTPLLINKTMLDENEDEIETIIPEGSSDNQSDPQEIDTEELNLKLLSTYTIKVFPQYGAYGFINYNKNKDAVLLYGEFLNKSYNSEGFFNETE